MWKKINNYSYVVSDQGIVKNVQTGHVLKPFPIRWGKRPIKPLQIELWKEGLMERVLLHRLVYEYFGDKVLLPSDDVHHLDLDPSNNDISNLLAIDHALHTRLHKLGLF